MSPRPSSATVVIVGGFATPRLALLPLARWTRRAGFAPTVVCPHAGLDCSERSYQTVLHVVRRVADASEDPPWLVAHSRGGQFARVLATRHPQLVAGLVTLGTPFAPGLCSVNQYTQTRIRALALIGSAGVPNLVTLDCLRGNCCNSFWYDLGRPWPEALPFHAIYAERDRVVRWRDALDPAACTEVIPATHLSLLTSRASLHAVARRLGSVCPRPGSIPEAAFGSG